MHRLRIQTGKLDVRGAAIQSDWLTKMQKSLPWAIANYTNDGNQMVLIRNGLEGTCGGRYRLDFFDCDVY